MAHTCSVCGGGRCRRTLVPSIDWEAWEEDLDRRDCFVWSRKSKLRVNYRYSHDCVSWKATTHAPRQWARHKGGIGLLTLKHSLAHWYTHGYPIEEEIDGQALIGWDEFIYAYLALKYEREIA